MEKNTFSRYFRLSMINQLIFFRADKSNQKKLLKAPTLSLQQQKQRQREKANVAKRLKEYQRQPSTLLIGTDHSSPHSFTPTLEGKPIATPITILKSSKTEDTRSIERTERARERKTSRSLEAGQPHRTSQSNSNLSPEGGLSRSISGSSMTSSSAEKRKRRPSDGDQPTKKRRDSEKSSIHRQISKQFDQNEGDFDPTPLRKNVTKGLKDALKTRVEKTEGITIIEEDLDQLVKDIEEALYKLYNRDVGSKYKSKYRSLVFNIKDPKNNGLFRKIVRKEYSTNRIAAMTAEEMASKELKEWRQAELKHDIEKIKSHEIEMAQLGAKFVMKTHKGDLVMEDGRTSSMVDLKNQEVKLPDEVSILLLS